MTKQIADKEILDMFISQSDSRISKLLQMRQRRMKQVRDLKKVNKDEDTKDHVKINNQYRIKGLLEEIQDIEDEMIIKN